MERADQVLVDETLSGNVDAYDLLMRRYERLVYKVAYGFEKRREAALDITQNTFLKAYNGLPGYRRDSNFKAWLMRIAYNEGINWGRRQRRHQEGHQPLENSPPVAAADESPHRRLLRKERKALILEGLEGLNQKYRMAVTLHYFQGMPIREVAEVLQCSEGTAKSILFRSVRRLRDSLAPTA